MHAVVEPACAAQHFCSSLKKSFAEAPKRNCMKPVFFTQSSGSSTAIKRLASLFTTAFFLLISTSSWSQDVLMGLTSKGGPKGMGTAFSYKTDSKAFTVIKGFADWGTNPESDLLRASDGQLYGMAPFGGTFDYGTL